VHESTIDVEALIAAFPHHRLAEMELPAGRRTISIGDCRTFPTPVFLISFNRGRMLKRTIVSIRGLSHTHEIVIHDNGSTDPETQAHPSMSSRGTAMKVFRYPAITSPDELNRWMKPYRNTSPIGASPGAMLLSDCDVDLSIADRSVLEVYDELLNKFVKSNASVPMLRIRDIRAPIRFTTG